MGRLIDLTHAKFGQLTVVRRCFPNGPQGQPNWICRCSCLNTVVVCGQSLRCGYTNSCGCLHRRQLSDRMKGQPFRHLFNRMRYSGKPVTLTFQEFLEFTKVEQCHYCGERIEWNPHRTVANARKGYNLDRKDNTQGYAKDNCVVCCPRCNLGKGDLFSYAEWVEIGKTIRRLREENYEFDDQAVS